MITAVFNICCLLLFSFSLNVFVPCPIQVQRANKHIVFFVIFMQVNKYPGGIKENMEIIIQLSIYHKYET